MKYLNMFQWDPNWLHDLLWLWFLTAWPPEYIKKNIITVLLLTVWGMWVVTVELICLFMHLSEKPVSLSHFLSCKTELVSSHKKSKIQNQNITKNSPDELHDFNTSDLNKKNARLLNILHIYKNIILFSMPEQTRKQIMPEITEVIIKKFCGNFQLVMKIIQYRS